MPSLCSVLPLCKPPSASVHHISVCSALISPSSSAFLSTHSLLRHVYLPKTTLSISWWKRWTDTERERERERVEVETEKQVESAVVMATHRFPYKATEWYHMVGTAWALEGGTGCTEQERERATRGDSEGRREGFFLCQQGRGARETVRGRERERERERESGGQDRRRRRRGRMRC